VVCKISTLDAEEFGCQNSMKEVLVDPKKDLMKTEFKLLPLPKDRPMEKNRSSSRGIGFFRFGLG